MKYFFPLLLLLTMISCFEQGDCSDVSTEDMRVSFFSQVDKKSKSLAIDSIKVLGWDTVMYSKKNASSVILPVNPAGSTLKYFIFFESKVATLDIVYSSRTFALAPGCQVIDLITIDDATATLIKAVTITKPDLAKNETENIKLYF